MMASSQQRNNRPLSDALEINPLSRGWTFLAQCLQKSKPRVGANGSDYRNYVFCDTKGTIISVVTYDAAIAKFNRLLQPYKRYYISNAVVRDANRDYQLGEYRYSWTLYSRTPVSVFSERIPPSLPCAFDFIRCEDMYRQADSETPIAFRGIIVASFSVPHHTKDCIWDYIVVNHQMKPMIMRLWSDVLDNEESNVSSRLPQPTIIAGVNLKITTHHGLAMTTRKNSFFLHDPPYPEADPLLAWYNRNASEIKKLVDEEAYLDRNKLLPPPSDDMITSVNDFEANRSKTKAAWLSAFIYLLPGQEKLWYSACHNCGKSYDADVGWETTCTGCGKETKLQARSHIGVFLNDGTGTIEATMFSPEAEN